MKTTTSSTVEPQKRMDELTPHLDHLRAAPKESAPVDLIARRPAKDQREVLGEGELDTTVGLVGDNWAIRGSSKTPDGSANPEAQLTLMNSRVASLIIGESEQWPLAGDQIYVDLDLSVENLPPGTRLSIGSAIVEISQTPHTGCKKFRARFGLDALKFISSDEGKALRLRGVNAMVVQSGTVRTGDSVTKLA